MLPGLRAAADRVLFDVANLKYAVDVLDGELDARCPATGWTVRQTLAHLPDWLAFHASAVERWLANEPLVPEGWEIDAQNAEMVDRHTGTTGAAIVLDLQAARDRLIRVYERVTVARAAEPIPTARGETTVVALAEGATRHTIGHVLDLLEASPRLRSDLFLLNWALWDVVLTDADWMARRQHIVDDVQEQLKQRKKAKRKKKD
jgi:hypothetical protein